MPIKRRDFLATSAALAGVAGLGIRPSFAQAEPSYKPEEGKPQASQMDALRQGR